MNPGHSDIRKTLFGSILLLLLCAGIVAPLLSAGLQCVLNTELHEKVDKEDLIEKEFLVEKKQSADLLGFPMEGSSTPFKHKGCYTHSITTPPPEC